MTNAKLRAVLPALLAGALLGAWLGARAERRAWRHLHAHGPDPERALAHFRRDLSLREDQIDGVRRALVSRRGRFDQIRREADEKLEALRAETDADIQKVLDETQKKRFEEWRRRWEREHGESRGPGPR